MCVGVKSAWSNCKVWLSGELLFWRRRVSGWGQDCRDMPVLMKVKATLNNTDEVKVKV
jgi:hypothetical protein